MIYFFSKTKQKFSFGTNTENKARNTKLTREKSKESIRADVTNADWHLRRTIRKSKISKRLFNTLIIGIINRGLDHWHILCPGTKKKNAFKLNILLWKWTFLHSFLLLPKSDNENLKKISKKKNNCYFRIPCLSILNFQLTDTRECKVQVQTRSI